MKKFILVLLILLTPLCLFGCQQRNAYYTEVEQNRFVLLKTYKGDFQYFYKIIVDRETRIMYLQVEGAYRGGITVLLDGNGNPQKYEGEL